MTKSERHASLYKGMDSVEALKFSIALEEALILEFPNHRKSVACCRQYGDSCRVTRPAHHQDPGLHRSQSRSRGRLRSARSFARSARDSFVTRVQVWGHNVSYGPKSPRIGPSDPLPKVGISGIVLGT
jgi:hypothetical protein